MKLSLFILAILASTVATGQRAEAQNYPWCAIYNSADPPASCGFVSYDQCMLTVSGIGGFCMANNVYQAPASVVRPHHAPKHAAHSQS